MAVVLDASALLAYLREEPGAEVVDGLLADARMASVNWAEVMQKSLSAGVDVDGMQEELQALGMRVEPLWPVDGERAGRLRPLTRQQGLSLVDRACLSLGSAAAGLGGSAPALRFIGHDRTRRSSHPWRRLIRFSPPRSRPAATATPETPVQHRAHQRRRAVAVRRWRATPPRPGRGESATSPGERHWPDR